MTDFKLLLSTAMGLGLASDRSNAELQLQNLCMQDHTQFFTKLVQELIQENNPTELRQFAGTLIKNSIRLLVNGELLWNLLDQNLREQIKQTLLSTMICKISIVKKSCANAISTIFTVEVVQGRWNNLIDDLTASSQPHVSSDIRKAAILTLGQICDKLKEFKLGQLLSEKTKENVLMAILIGLSQDEADLEIRENSIIALGDCVEFMTNILEREQVRDYATGLLIDALSHSNDNIRTTALQRSTDYVKAIYVHFGKYASAVLKATQPSIENADTDICSPAIEIWMTIAHEYLERKVNNNQVNRVNNEQTVNPNHILQVQEELVQLLLKNLLKNDDEDEDESESQIQDASQKALCSIVECVGDVVVKTFTAFISNTISNSAWQYRQAAILAFGSLMEGTEENTIVGLINSVLPTFVNTLKDQHKKIRESGAKLLVKIADFHPKTILLRENVGNELTIALQSLKESPAISRQICLFFSNLMENLEKYPQNQLSGSLDQLVSAFVENATRTDFGSNDLSLITSSFMPVLKIIYSSHDAAMGSKYFNFFMNSFDNTYQLPNDRRIEIQSGILSVLQECLIAMDNQFDKSQTQRVVDLVIRYFTYIKDIDAGGMYLISALSTCVDTDFVAYLDNVWPYIEHALKNKLDDEDLMKTSIGAIADIARACQTQFMSKIDVLTQLFFAIQLPQINRSIKLSMFSCIGDIFLAVRDQASAYLPNLIQIFDKGFTAAIELQQVDSSDSQEYAESLKEKLIESYTSVLHGINQSSTNQAFLIHFPKVVEFIMFTCNKQLHPTVDYVRSCLNLLIDIGKFYQSKAAPQIKTLFTKELIETLQQYDASEDGKETIQYALRIISQI